MAQMYYAGNVKYSTEADSSLPAFEYIRQRRDGSNQKVVTIYCANAQDFLACLDYWNACANLNLVAQDDNKRWTYRPNADDMLNFNSNDMMSKTKTH